MLYRPVEFTRPQGQGALGAHLSIDDQKLLLLPRTLSLNTDSTSLEGHRENLALLLESRGLRRIPVSESSFVNDEVAFQWLAQGRLDFNRHTFREACKREGLLDGDGELMGCSV